ncbi:GGDEF domain-containing protein [Aquabacterium sp.]|uniref:GGDEF domain-containing protein n=1 Tax=Aquabacterium sp. TaxID=1872578 RepID=UPI0037839FB1
MASTLSERIPDASGRSAAPRQRLPGRWHVFALALLGLAALAAAPLLAQPLVGLLGALSAAALVHAWYATQRCETCLAELSTMAACLAQCTRERDLALADGAALNVALRRDTLTPLANRTAFFETLDALVDRRRQEGGRFVVFYIDLDDFKPVNDRHGHAAGDALLRAFGARLRAAVRHGDLAARIGGDEFALVIDGLFAPAALTVAQALLDDLMQPYAIAGGTLQVSASLGIATFPDNGSDARQLVQAADSAMYRAKAAGKGGFMASDWAALGLD